MSNTQATETRETATQIRVFWTNMGYFSAETFDTLAAADAYAKLKGFEATFFQAGQIIASRTVFGGFREIR